MALRVTLVALLSLCYKSPFLIGFCGDPLWRLLPLDVRSLATEVTSCISALPAET